MRAFILLSALALGPLANSAVRFDVFVGYDGYVPQVGWFPVVCEVENSGPGFNALFEFSPAQYSDNNRRLMPVELPTGTTKRFVIPVPAQGGYGSQWSARLLDEKGRVRAEWSGRQARRMVPWQIPLTAALTRTSAGVPVFPEIMAQQQDLSPVVARLQPAVFPDNPLSLEGLRTIYLSSERALELSARQANALATWLHGGGHLIVGVDQLSQVNGNPWLSRLIPIDLADSASRNTHEGLHAWICSSNRFDGAGEQFIESLDDPGPPRGRRPNTGFFGKPGKNPWADLRPDSAFESAGLQTVRGRLRDGWVLAGTTAEPLVVAASRGRGQITVLLFSPELEPFLSWNHRGVFWARMADVPPELFSNKNFTRAGWRSIDGVLGSIVDSKQIRKLPVGWLMLLLVGYLVVIGPLDRWWLKKINRPMLTWITFPLYVALFSGLIYLIGYKLRAGETEWNELHVVDLIPRGTDADWRGRTYGSVYSPANASYRFAGSEKFASFRPEYLGTYGGRSSGRMKVIEKDSGFESEASVPVWTVQMFVSEWWDQGEPPLRFAVQDSSPGARGQLTVRIENRLDRPARNVKVVWKDRVYEVGSIASKTTTNVGLTVSTALSDFVNKHAQYFEQAVNARQQAFGGGSDYRIKDIPNTVTATSFLSNFRRGQNQSFIQEPGLDLSSLLDRGDVVLLAWVPDYSPVRPFNQFNARRSHRDTVFRMSIPTK